MKSVGVVVLNYKNYNDTIECVDSLLLQQNVKLEILIIDNNSRNRSLEILKKQYENIGNVTLIANDENFGFARGNNVGIRHARELKECEYVFVLNSDTVLTNSTSIFYILDAHSENIAVISPVVIGIDGVWQAPAFFTRKRLRRQTIFIFLSVLLKSFTPNLLKWMVLSKRKFLCDSKQSKKEDVTMNPSVKDRSAYIIQGSAYMLTPDFFRYYRQLYPKTFLYWEELCLSWYLHKVGLGTALADNPPIVHKGGRSLSYGRLEKESECVRQRFVVSGCLKVLPLFFMKYSQILTKYN